MLQNRKPHQYRQGDYLLIEPGDFEWKNESGVLCRLSIQECPVEATVEKRKQGRCIIGEGEITGHHHAVIEKTASILEKDGLRWLDAPKGAELLHEEHRTIELPSGTYRIVQQRVYHAGKVQRVVD